MKKGVLIGIVCIVVAVAVVAVVFLSLQVEGLRTEDLEPKIGDEWRYRYTMENGMVMLIDIEVKKVESVTIGEHSCEAYVIEGSADIEDYGTLLPEGLSVVSCDVDVTMYKEKDGPSSEMIMDMTLVLEYIGTTYSMKYKTVSISEVVSGEGPDIVEVGSSWSTTERSIENTTMTFLGETETETTESTSTVNYECVGTRNVSVGAGTFYCYEVRKTIVGSEGYSLDYYSLKTKLPVKSIEYQDSQITSLMELVSYDVS